MTAMPSAPPIIDDDDADTRAYVAAQRRGERLSAMLRYTALFAEAMQRASSAPAARS